ncbi:ACT domain-containing protein [Tautonia rosea]|uniref:ACT domain-containing protein n=1 Tax=Tautonia rosea TaxID=2728037 RepID=UPI0014751F5A|nr:ACT domain-containing protein [Tautonia rosea]
MAGSPGPRPPGLQPDRRPRLDRRPLAAAEVNRFVVSTFDTDYVLMPGRLLSRAVEVLLQACHEVRDL